MNVVSTHAGTRRRVCGAFRVDVVTRQTRRHLLSRVAQTCQTRRHLLSRVARTRQTCRHSPKAIFEKNVTRLDKFAQVTREWPFLKKKPKKIVNPKGSISESLMLF